MFQLRGKWIIENGEVLRAYGKFAFRATHGYPQSDHDHRLETVMSSSVHKQATNEARFVAHTAAGAFGGVASVRRYTDRDDTHSLSILTCQDAPLEGYRTYSTLGVHEERNVLDAQDIRVELCGVTTSSMDLFPNMLGTAAFQVIKDEWLAAPGVVFPSLVSEYGLSDTLDHVLWVEPFPWEELSTVEVSSELSVHWLLAIPIAESERRFLLERGLFVLESLFEEHDVAYYDLQRQPVV